MQATVHSPEEEQHNTHTITNSCTSGAAVGLNIDGKAAFYHVGYVGSWMVKELTRRL